MKYVSDQVADFVHAGGRAGVGSHGQFQGLGYHWELWNMASGKLTPHEALRSATIMGADMIGRAQGRRLDRGRQARRHSRDGRESARQHQE